MRDVATFDADPIESSGLGEVANYTIQADGAMFRILIDGLYSDKPRAVIRELCTNARDSHAEAGILDRPFVLQLPNRFDETFQVRDFGVSLTHEQVMHLYTTVGLSTKKDSNTSVGKFGLGSKVPFAVTDSFTITAILEGERRIYNAFMDAGTPKIALLTREPTDEEQGVAVSFPVRQDQHAAFVAAAKRVLLGFDVIPSNNAGLEKIEFETLFEGADWKVVKRDYVNELRGAYIRQGCVLYPVDVAALRNTRPCQALDVLGQEGVILNMPIGTVDITPSRESLSYDATTVGNILDKLDSILEEVATTLRDQVLNAPSFYDAIKARNKLLENLTSHQIREYIGRNTFWRGKRVSSEILVDHDQIKQLRRHGVDLELSTANYRRRGSAKHQLAPAHSFRLDPTSLPIVYYIEPGEHVTYIGARLSEISHQRAIFLRNFVPGGWSEKFLRVALGRPSEPLVFRKLSDVEFVKPDYSKTLATIGTYNGHKFTSGTLEGDGPVYYVHTRNGIVRRGDTDASNSAVWNVWTKLVELELVAKDATLVGIPASRKDLAKTIPDEWEDFFETAETLIREKFDAEKAAKFNLSGGFRNQGKNNLWLNVLEWLAPEMDAQSVGVDSTLRTCLSSLSSYLEQAGDGALHETLAALIPSIFEKTEATALLGHFSGAGWEAEFNKAMNRIKTTYPLLGVLVRACGWSATNDDKDRAGLLDYVNLIDARENTTSAENTLWDDFSD